MQENVVEYNSAEHAIINSVDNSNSVINFNDADEINFILERYFKIQKKYYNLMKLNTRPDQTQTRSRPDET